MTVLPQLRVRSEYSFRTAYGPVPEVAAGLAQLGVKSAGMVDRVGTWGHVAWEKELKALDITPMFGTEAIIRGEDTKGGPAAWYLGEDIAKFYAFSSSDPNTEQEFIEAQGVVRFAGAALTNPDAFDYVDINTRSRRRTMAALQLAKQTGKPIVVTGDNDYPTPEARNRFLAWDDSKRMTLQHIPSDKELEDALRPYFTPQEYKAAIRNTHEAAERASGLELRVAPMIAVEGDLKALAQAGKEYRLARGHISDWDDVYEARLQRELQIIEEKDYQSYFVVVADLVLWAKQRMLVGPARGSSAGSLVCYLLQITEVDPLVHDLIFERFIDLNRDDLPDIDIDFSDTRRHLVLDYLSEKYGQANVARIGTVSRLKPRSVMAHVGKKLGVPHGATFGVANVLLEYSSGDARYGSGLEDTLKITQPGKDLLERYPEAELMGELEGHASHTGQHAAGVIVSNVPVTEYCTVRQGIAQIDKKEAEKLNLLKIDMLGLRTLGVLEDTGLVTSQQLYDLKMDDPDVLSIFDEAKFSGVFQFEGAAQRRVSVQIPVDSFQKIDHITALARPGPLGGGATHAYIRRNQGKEAITFKHPSMEPYLGATMGVVLYQEQVMRIVREVGNFSWEEVTIIRRGMSRSMGRDFFDARGDIFTEGAARLDIPKDVAADIWNEICSFGAWGMNKCLAGNTKVKLAHPNQTLGSDPTIEELYHFYKTQPSAWVRQNKAMPKLLCVGEDHAAKPVEALDIVCNGPLPVVRYTFSDGSEVVCTRLHKFVINGEWNPIKTARLGDRFTFYAKQNHIKNHSFIRGQGWRKNRVGGAGDYINKRTNAMAIFRKRNLGKPCERCDKAGKRMEVHHNDHQHGKARPNDLSWFCSSCHKQTHMDAGDWLPPYSRGWLETEEPVYLVKQEELPDEVTTYDIEMPAPHHNFLLANGLLTHNSHTVSYSIISYWCAYMKRYHPLEYAAACLRNAKDDEQVVEILRELTKEGITYTPFDPQLSGVNWSAADGQLLGGYTNLVGIGKVKANRYVNKRDQGGGLTDADLRALGKLRSKHEDLTPAHTLWGDMYRHPAKYKINGRVKQIAELEDGENAVIICRLVKQERRDENEQVRVSKRGDKRMEGPTLFLDTFVVDDSVSKPVLLRLKIPHWETHGEKLSDRAIAGQEWFLVRGRWLKDFSMMIMKRIKCLSNPELFD